MEIEQTMNAKVSLPAPKSKPEYTVAEEIANSITHGIGSALAVAALSILVTLSALAGDARRVVSFSIYGACLFLLYLASTLYHSFPWPKVKRIFRMFDHAAIYLLIAGTYTPFTLVALRGTWGWTLFGVIWGLAIAGIILTFSGLHRLRWLSVVFYIGMGWLVIIAVKPLYDAVSPDGFLWVMLGGASYTVGVVAYLLDRIPYNHAIWHLFVLGGSICHFFGLLFHVLPPKGA